MKRKLFIGLGISIFLLIGCSPQSPKSTLNNENNRTIKRFLIDVDKEIKKSSLKGLILGSTKEDILSIGNNDEVSFVGKEVFLATPIYLLINGERKKIILSSEDELVVKGSRVTDGDTIVIKNRFGKQLIKRKVEKP